jgi:hypothetical protein
MLKGILWGFKAIFLRSYPSKYWKQPHRLIYKFNGSGRLRTRQGSSVVFQGSHSLGFDFLRSLLLHSICLFLERSHTRLYCHIICLPRTMNCRVIGWGIQNRFEVVGAALSGWRAAPKFCSDTTTQPCSCMPLSSSLILIEYNLERVVSMKSDVTPHKRGAE